MKAWVCNLLVQVLMGLASTITLESKFHRTYHILLSRLRLGFLFVASYDLQGYRGSILTYLHMGLCHLFG
jgi:hypothetical protein